MAPIATKRLTKELNDLKAEGGTPVGCQLYKVEDNLLEWFLTISVLGETVYEGDTFLLRFRFTMNYPIEVPEVVFVVDEPKWQAPCHPHVYSNGHICASILGDGWSPVLNVSTVCITLQSMLASCKKKERPIGNDRYVKHAPLSPKQTRFVYDDDKV